MDPFNEGFDMFTLVPIFIGIIFVVVISIFLYAIISGIKQWNHNNKQPKLNVVAHVVSKRTEVSGGGENSSSSTWYYLTFQVESGDRMEFSVNGREYGMIAEGDIGELTFQGTRYHSFLRKQNSNV